MDQSISATGDINTSDLNGNTIVQSAVSEGLS